MRSPNPGELSNGEELLLFAVVILALAALGIAFYAVYGMARMRDQMDDFIDRNTPSFAEEHKEPEDTDEIPVSVPTEPNGMSLAVEAREFIRPDGTTAQFRFRSST